MAEETKTTPVEETVEETAQTTQKVKAEKPKKTTKQSKALAEAEEKYAALQEQMLRTLAEYDNYRKRTQKEKDAMYGDGIVATVKAFLPVIDNLERAIAAGEDGPFKEGVSMILHQTNEVLASMGVTLCGEVGDPFDPNFHAAVMHVEDENLPESSIAEVLQKGYVYKDGKVIRHAAVKVAN